MKSIIFISLVLLFNCILAWDYLMFVQVWPPSWIENDKIKYPFTNDYFTIHGLWSQYYNDTWPEYCNKTNKFNISKIDFIKPNLTKYWTNFKNPQLFWQHEYEKHMLCTTDTYQDPYVLFQYGLELRNKFNFYNLFRANNIIPNNNNSIIKYNVQDLLLILKKNIGFNSIITCPNAVLTEIRLCMNKQFELFDCPNDENNDEQCKLDQIIYNKLVF